MWVGVCQTDPYTENQLKCSTIIQNNVSWGGTRLLVICWRGDLGDIFGVSKGTFEHFQKVLSCKRDDS